MKKPHLALIILGIVFNLITESNYAQDYYVFHLKDGSEVIGEAVFDTLRGVYVIESMEGIDLQLDPSKIKSDEMGLFITPYERVMFPPRRVLPERGVDTCRIHSPFHLSIKGLAHYVNDITFGGEANIGFRWSGFIFGFGSGIWLLKDEYRYPVFIYIQKYLMNSCLRPFINTNLGYIFDKYTYDNGIQPTFKNIFKASPKFASIGLGIDIPISKKFDLTIESGYRYITITSEIDAASCDGPIPTIGFVELHAAYAKIALSF